MVRMRWVVWSAVVVGGAVLAVVLVADRGHDASAKPRPRPLGAIVADYRRAHAAAATRSREGRVVGRGAPVWRAARRCLPDWRAAPEERKDALLELYGVASAQPSLAGEIAVGRSWLAALRGIRDLERVPRLLEAHRRLARAVGALATLREVELDPCAVVGSWRRAGWSVARRPAALRRVQRALRELAAAQHGAPLIDLGVPDALNRCEPVIETLAPDDSFCG
jgi:hypothetical protein